MSDYEYLSSKEVVRFTEAINGNPVIIDVSRECVEDKLAVTSAKPEEMIAFVERNHNQIVENLSTFLRHAPDVTGLVLGIDQLQHCR